VTVAWLALVLGTVDAGTGALPAGIDAGPPVLPMPVAAPTPAPPGPAEAGTPDIPAFAIRSVATAEPVVALTFDACATAKQANGFDRQVFDILAKDRIPVTFYLSGRWVQKHPTAAKTIAPADFIELGNHSYTHPRLTLLRADRLRAQIRYTNRILERSLGRKPLSLRPPGGAWDGRVVRAAGLESLPVVTWTVVSGDVGGRVPPARMVRTVLDQARPGAIIIFHINRREPYTKSALPDIIAGLREKGLRFATVSQLLALPDAKPEAARPSRFGFHMGGKPHAPAGPQAAPTPAPAPQPEGEELAHPPT
jgi:peptidoglycan/xylan/chitin deacetylase (PgdA/CDA1 family)